jgi:hypothetical protein
MLDIWYNFFGPHRPQFALWGLILLGLITTANATWSVSGLGTVFTVFVCSFGLLMWYLFLPAIIFLIDHKNGKTHVRPNSPWKNET